MITATSHRSPLPIVIDPWSLAGMQLRLSNMFREKANRTLVPISSKYAGSGNFTSKVLIDRRNLEKGDKPLESSMVEKVVSGVSKFRRLDVIQALQLGKKVDWSNEALGNLPEVKAQNSRVLAEIQSDGFKVKQIYFDTQSTPIEEINYSRGVYQLFNLEKDLAGFLKNKPNLSTEEVEGIERALRKVRKSQNRCLLIAAIQFSASDQGKGVLKNILNCVRKRSASDKPVEELVKELKEFTSSMLLDLNEGESLIIPFQYSLDLELDIKITAHAILFEVMKKNGEFELKIFNTGLGSNFHKQEAGKIYPVTLKNISSEMLISLFNKDLLGVELAGTVLSDEAMIYTLVRKRVVTNGGKTNFFEGKPYAPQKVGSCTEESLQVWLEAELDTVSGVCQKFRKYKLESEIKDCRQIESLLLNKKTLSSFSPIGADQLTSMISDGEKRLKEQSQVYYPFSEEMPSFLDFGQGEELLQAVANGDAEDVGELLKSSFLFLSVSERNYAFLEAAKGGHLEVMKKFLEGSGYWTVNSRTLDAASNLAAEDGNLEVLRFLVERYYQKGSSRFCMFALAASHSQLVIMKFLNEDKKMSVSDQQSGMELAACYGETLALDYLISLGIFNGNDIGMALDLAGEDVSIPVLVKLLPFIPFMYSGKVLNNLAKREQETKLAVLLYMVQDLPEEFKNKAFLEAAKNNNPKNMNVLLSKDLFLEHSCQLQEAFIEAIINDHADVVEVVLDLLKLKGFESVDLKDEFKLAVKGNCVGVARLLLQRGGIEKELVAAECVKIEEGSDLRGVLEAFCSSST